MVELAGVDHVGFGSDFDGVGPSLPTGLKDVSQYPNLIAELLRRGAIPSAKSRRSARETCCAWEEAEEVASRAAISSR